MDFIILHYKLLDKDLEGPVKPISLSFPSQSDDMASLLELASISCAIGVIFDLGLMWDFFSSEICI
jgi:hypothetical protein